MDISYIPILTDATKLYYEESEVIELCDLFDVDLEFDGRDSPAYMKLARRLITQIEHGNNRRFLETLVPHLLTRASERVAHTSFKKQYYHGKMEDSLNRLKVALKEQGIPRELSVPEDQPFTAKSETREFLGKAETGVTVVDNYIGLGTLDCLRDIQQQIRLLTGVHGNSVETNFDRALQEFRSEDHEIEVRRHEKLHDRYVIFNERCWLVGSSLKDAGKKILNMIEFVDGKATVVGEVERKWAEAKKLEM